VEWTKLTIVVDDLGQDHKVEDLAQSEGIDSDEELAREEDTTI